MGVLFAGSREIVELRWNSLHFIWTGLLSFATRSALALGGWAGCAMAIAPLGGVHSYLWRQFVVQAATAAIRFASLRRPQAGRLQGPKGNVPVPTHV